MDVRTDLAIELHAEAVRRSENKRLDGVEVTEKSNGEFSINDIRIKNERGAKLLGRPVGEYVTVEFGRVGVAESEKFYRLCDVVREQLSRLVLKKCGFMPKNVLVVGLGNADITADAVGPLSVKNVLVTAHLKKLSPELFESFGGVEVKAIATGVMAQTGMESADVVKSVCERRRPQIVIAIDALASNMTSRLAAALQITDTGIRPGSGIGNTRDGIDEDFLGVPVVSIGLPTMVEIAMLVTDALSKMKLNGTAAYVRDVLGCNGNMLVTPKDCGVIISDISKLIGFAVSRTFISDLEYDELARLVN